MIVYAASFTTIIESLDQFKLRIKDAEFIPQNVGKWSAYTEGKDMGRLQSHSSASKRVFALSLLDGKYIANESECLKPGETWEATRQIIIESPRGAVENWLKSLSR